MRLCLKSPLHNGEAASCRFFKATVPTVTLSHHLAMAVPPHRWIDRNELFTFVVLEKFLCAIAPGLRRLPARSHQDL